MNECIFDIDPKLLSLASEAENECREMFEKIMKALEKKLKNSKTNMKRAKKTRKVL